MKIKPAEEQKKSRSIEKEQKNRKRAEADQKKGKTTMDDYEKSDSGISQENISMQSQENSSIQSKELDKSMEPVVAFEKVSIMQQNFVYLGLVTVLYACFFTFCLYKNASGITMPLFVMGTLYYYSLCMKKLKVQRKKDCHFYEIAVVLLGCATWITADERIIAMNYMVIFVLMVTYMLHQFFKDEEWDVPQYIANFCIAIVEPIFCLPQPFVDCNHMIRSRQKEKNPKIQYVFIGLLLAVPFVFIILMLLSSADFVFANSLEFLWKNIAIPENIIGIAVMTIFAFFTSYCFIASLTKEKAKEKKGSRKEGEPLIAITFTSLIAIIYIIFCGIQIIYLFMGNMHLPNEYTYAQYAREGFFQLVEVCLLNLTLVLFCIYYYKDHKVLKIILTIISLCTYIMIASSGFRMILYIGQYQLTFLRVFVLWALVVIFALMTGINIYIIKPRFNLLKYAIVVVTALYIVLSFSHPDYFIAMYNYSEFEFDNAEGLARIDLDYGSYGTERDYMTDEEYAEYGVDRIDTDYLSELCGDAASVILDYTNRLEDEAGVSMSSSSNSKFYYYFERVYDSGKDMDCRTFNLSRYIGKNVANDFMKGNNLK